MGLVMGFIGSYGLWLVLAAVFLTMHWFGMRCCGGRHAGNGGRVRTTTDSHGEVSDQGSGR